MYKNLLQFIIIILIDLQKMQISRIPVFGPFWFLQDLPEILCQQRVSVFAAGDCIVVLLQKSIKS
jgi:hypothetical protein